MKPPGGALNFQNSPPGHKYKASIEPEEAKADRAVRLFKDVSLFLVAVGFVLLMVGLCVRTLLSTETQPEEKKWAMSILSAAAGGIIGYLIRK